MRSGGSKGMVCRVRVVSLLAVLSTIIIALGLRAGEVCTVELTFDFNTCRCYCDQK